MLISRRRVFGWRRFEHEPTEAALIRDAVARVLAGASLHSIAQEWAAQGVTTVNGNPWDATGVRNALINPRHAGLQQYRGEIVGQGVWEPIVSREQHERLTALCNRRKRGPGRPRAHLLSGILRCGRCGAGLVASSTNGARKYGCAAQGCGRIHVMAEPVEEIVTGALLGALVIAERLQQTRRALERLDVPAVPADPGGWWAGADVDQRRALLGVLFERIDVTSVITTFLNIGRMFDTLGVSDPVLFSRPVP